MIPAKHYVYAVIEKETDVLVAVELTRQLARTEAERTLLEYRVRRAKLTLFDS